MATRSARFESPAAAGRVEWLDLLRGLSAFAIVLFHVRVTLWLGFRTLLATPEYSWIDRASAWITLPFPFFGSAVMLFFIVSGFAIHYPYAGGRDFSLRSYGARRFFRIYPPYLAVLVLTALAEYVSATLIGAPVSSRAKFWASALMAQNYAAPAGQMAANPSLWSLPVEVELYLVYPLLLLLWRRAGTVRTVACVMVVSAAAAAALLSGQQWPMGNFAKYWIIWMSGAVLAEWARTNSLPQWRWWHSVLGISAAVAAVLCRAVGVNVGIEHFAWGAAYFVLVLWGLGRPDIVRALPRRIRDAGLFLGSISYSLYLVHFPVLVVAGAAWIAMFGGKPASVAIPLVASLLPVLVAYALWRFIERPSQTYGRARSSSPAPVAAPAAASLA